MTHAKAAPAPSHAREMRCGTLAYTRFSITLLFAWLLWGDFCFTLMESVVPSIVPLKLQKLGASAALISTIMTTLPAILNLTVCPWVSFKSDRHRSRWGRRIPFIVSTMPFLCVSLVLMGWSEDLAGAVAAWLPWLNTVSPVSLAIWFLAVFMVVFQFFNMFVNSVFWYLFNDVVPGHMLGRFTSLMRIVGTGAGATYSGFVFPHALTHMREIFTGAALLYFAGFGLMCLFVREGEYPPPPDDGQPHVGPIQEFIRNFRTYMKESFSSRFYWYFYLSQAFFAMACAGGVFGMFLSLEMGLNLAQMGKLAMIGQIIGMVAMYFAAIFVDRWHPMRIMTYMAVFGAVSGFGGWMWLLITFPPTLYFWANVAGTFVGVFAGALNGACFLPAFMRLMPKSRYGQLSSAYAMVRSAATIVAGVLAGLFMDVILKCYGGSTFAYRYLFLWFWGFNVLTTICYVLAYRKWLALGGDADYRAPAPWEPSGYEETNDMTPSAPGNPRLLMVALHLNTAMYALGLAAIPALMVILRTDAAIRLPVRWATFTLQLHAMPLAVDCIRLFLLPASALLLLLWLRLVWSVQRDLARSRAGAVPRRGIPHHGVLLVLAIQGLLNVPVTWFQFGWLIHLGLEYELVVFGVSGVLAGLAGIAAVHLIRMLETGVRAPARGAAPTPVGLRSKGTA